MDDMKNLYPNYPPKTIGYKGFFDMVKELFKLNRAALKENMPCRVEIHLPLRWK